MRSMVFVLALLLSATAARAEELKFTGTQSAQAQGGEPIRWSPPLREVLRLSNGAHLSCDNGKDIVVRVGDTRVEFSCEPKLD
jgi:hypothetical protein